MIYLYEAIKPTRLYIKQCPKTGLKYFGKSTRNDIEKYWGSGKKWIRHLNKHNVSPVHLWNSDWYYDSSISRFAVLFSHLNKIVESDDWANLKIEDGLEGGWDHVKWDSERRKKKSQERKGMHTLVDKEGNTFFGSISEIDYINVFPLRYNKVYVEDKDGKRFNTTKDDPRFETGEIFGLNKGKKGMADHLNKKKHVCIHCGFVTTIGNIVRWHNDNCKQKDTKDVDKLY